MTITNSCSSTNDKSGLKIGFIGFGTIASAIATGIAKQTKFPVASITVSRRSASKSLALQQTFPHFVTISDDTQEIIDQSPDLIFLCVLPEIVKKVLHDTTFQNCTATLVSVVASAELDELVELTGLPTDRVAKMICTPSIAQHEGVCLLHHPRDNTESSSSSSSASSSTNSHLLSKLLDAISGCVECTTTEQMNVLMSGMCVMGPIYGLLQTHIDWLKSKGVSNKDANFLVTRQYTAILRDAMIESNHGDNNNNNNNKKKDKTMESGSNNADENGENRVEQLIEEQTKNGINEQALDNWKRSGSLKSYTNVLDAILDRLEKKSDGSIVQHDEQASATPSS